MTLAKCARRVWIAVPIVQCAVLALDGCSSRPPAPVPPDTRNDTCAHCRMAVSDVKFAAQLVAPGEEAKFFDDIGCLREYLKVATTLAPGTVAYVASHRTAVWVAAREAVYVRNERVETPMGFHLLAFESEAARDADPSATRAERLDVDGVFGGRLPGEARR